MRITIKGQVTIPQEVRDYAGFQPGTEVEFLIGEDGVVRVVAATSVAAARHRRLGAAISALRGSADTAMSTERIMALLRQ
jgi:AbrB family looped-hinge helix DNA binding protein